MRPLFRLVAAQRMGSVMVKVLPWLSSDDDRHGSPEPPHQGPDMGEADSLARLVLGAGAAKQVENPLVVLGIDAAAVVGDLENRKAELCPAPDQRYRRELPA